MWSISSRNKLQLRLERRAVPGISELDDPAYWQGLADKTRSLAYAGEPDTSPLLLEIANHCDELGRRAEERARRARKH